MPTKSQQDFQDRLHEAIRQDLKGPPKVAKGEVVDALAKLGLWFAALFAALYLALAYMLGLAPFQ